MAWAIGIILGLIVLAGLALQFAISQNGPAVLSLVDRIVGGSNNVALKAEVSTGDSDAQKLFVWGTEEADAAAAPLPVLVFVHGGSWRWGDPVDYDFIGRSFVPKGFVVVLAGYRMHPEAVYPAMLEDTASAIAWTKENIAEYGGDPDRIVIAGHSAGAYNVVQTALDQQWLAQLGHSPDDVAGVVGLSGPYDFYPFDSESTINSFGKAEKPEATQPIQQVRGDAPPMLLIHGEKDTLVFPRNTRELAKRLNEAGGAADTAFYEAMDHNQPLISLAAPWRNSRDLDDKVAEFAKRVTLDRQASVPVQAESR